MVCSFFCSTCQNTSPLKLFPKIEQTKDLNRAIISVNKFHFFQTTIGNNRDLSLFIIYSARSWVRSPAEFLHQRTLLQRAGSIPLSRNSSKRLVSLLAAMVTRRATAVPEHNSCGDTPPLYHPLRIFYKVSRRYSTYSKGTSQHPYFTFIQLS